jgi:hypothetical protein
MKLSYEEAFRLASHKHFKGSLYLEIGFVKDSSNGEYLVDLMTGNKQRVYVHLHPHDVEIWIRDEKEWEDLVPLNSESGCAVYRFKPVLGRSDVFHKLLRGEISINTERKDQTKIERGIYERAGIDTSKDTSNQIERQTGFLPELGYGYGQKNGVKEDI